MLSEKAGVGARTAIGGGGGLEHFTRAGVLLRFFFLAPFFFSSSSSSSPPFHFTFFFTLHPISLALLPSQSPVSSSFLFSTRILKDDP